jgi:hypothetical protein
MADRELEPDAAPHAVAKHVRRLDAQQAKETCHVFGHISKRERSFNIGGVAVTLQLDGDYSEGRSQRGQQILEAALDCAEGAVEENERSASTMDLVVDVHPVHGGIRAHADSESTTTRADRGCTSAPCGSRLLRHVHQVQHPCCERL